MERISNRWMKVILWVSGYLGALVFALVGGYVFLKTDREEVKSETKKVFLAFLAFVAIDMFLLFFAALCTFGVPAYRAYSVMTAIENILRLIVFGGMAIYSYVKNPGHAEVGSADKVAEPTDTTL